MQILRRLIGRRGRRGAMAGIADRVSALDEKIRSRESLDGVVPALDAARQPVFDLLRRRPGSALAAKALTLKVLNLLLAKREFLTRATHLLSRPYGLAIDPSNACNLACPGCVHSASVKTLKVFDWNQGLLSEVRFRALLESYGTSAFQIMFCNYGEPLTNRNTPRLIEMAKGYFVQTALSTNLAMARFDAESYVRCGLDFVILSIDGATQSVYERYRKKGNIEVVYRNIENLVRTKRKLRKSTPVIRWQFLAFEHNQHEIPDALDQARALGVDQFTVETPFDVSWDDPEVRPSEVPTQNIELHLGTEQQLSRNYEGYPDPLAAEIMEREFAASWTAKLAGRPPQLFPLADPPAKHTCHWLYKNMVMDANGRILPCCAAPMPGAQLVFSNFTPGEKQDCFNSELYQAARHSFADPTAPRPGPIPYCVDCQWDQTMADIDGDNIAQCLRTFGSGLFNSRAIDILSGW